MKSFTEVFQIFTRRLFDEKIQDLDMFIEEASDDDSEYLMDSIFKRDDDEFA